MLLNWRSNCVLASVYSLNRTIEFCSEIKCENAITKYGSEKVLGKSALLIA